MPTTPKIIRVQLAVTIDPELIAWVREEAARRLIGTSLLVEHAIRNLKATIPPADVATGMVGA